MQISGLMLAFLVNAGSVKLKRRINLKTGYETVSSNLGGGQKFNSQPCSVL
jgi:hypothetical protein